MNKLPVQELLHGEYLHIARLHKDLNDLSAVPHRHDHYEFILPLKGSGKHLIDYKPFDIQPNRLYFIQKGQVHIIENFEREGWLIFFGEELYSTFFKIHKQESENGLLDSYSPFPYIDLDENQLQKFIHLIEQINEELKAEKQDLNIIFHYVSLFILQANKIQVNQHPKEQLDLANRKLFQELKQLLEVKYKSEHLASYYAEKLNVDSKKLNAICRKTTGRTLFKLIQERLITESKIELQTSTGSIKEISYELGFNDPAFFGRFFKRHTGITPAEFRKKRLI